MYRQDIGQELMKIQKGRVVPFERIEVGLQLVRSRFLYPLSPESFIALASRCFGPSLSPQPCLLLVLSQYASVAHSAAYQS